MIFHFLKRLNRFLPESVRLFFIPFYRRLFPGVRHFLLMPFLRCNYSCSYCLINRFTPADTKEVYLPVADWITGLKKLPPSVFTLTGGEPMLYPDLVELVNSFPRQHIISSLVTNLSVKTEKLKEFQHKNFRIMVSFHPQMTSKEELGARIENLKDFGFREITVNFVAYPSHLGQILSLKEFFEREIKCSFRVDSFKDPTRPYVGGEIKMVQELKKRGIIPRNRTIEYNFGDFSRKTCLGGKSYGVILSDGKMFSCMEGFYYELLDHFKGKSNPQDRFYLGNIVRGEVTLRKKKNICHSPCSELCDIELAAVRSSKRTPC